MKIDERINGDDRQNPNTDRDGEEGTRETGNGESSVEEPESDAGSDAEESGEGAGDNESVSYGAEEPVGGAEGIPDNVAASNDENGGNESDAVGYDGEDVDHYEENTVDIIVELEETAPTETLTYAGAWTITFYCDCEQCVGQYAGMNMTASGLEPIPWYTVATGSSYPFGTVLYIDGFGYFEVMDRGVGDGWADIFVSHHGEIPSYGMTTADVYIVE